MNPNESLQLKKMINENNVEDLTGDIREKKHSEKIRSDVTRMIELKKKYPRLEKSNSEQFDSMLTSQCSFLFNNYTDIFNKVKKDEINLETLWQLLNILRRIEDGDVDQHTGSYEVGKLLKKIYIDSALAKENKTHSKSKKLKKPVKKQISWSDFKKLNN
jgi:hypothetical protein|tara:strand:- start:1073 stop:1552 length:480 start_codon:yes stop_codon:yes gene_type:complete